MATGTTTIPCLAETQGIPEGAIVLLGRFLFALIFLVFGPKQFSKQASAAKEVPDRTRS